MTAVSKPAHRVQMRLQPLVVAALAATSSGCITAHCAFEIIGAFMLRHVANTTKSDLINA